MRSPCDLRGGQLRQHFCDIKGCCSCTQTPHCPFLPPSLPPPSTLFLGSLTPKATAFLFLIAPVTFAQRAHRPRPSVRPSRIVLVQQRFSGDLCWFLARSLANEHLHYYRAFERPPAGSVPGAAVSGTRCTGRLSNAGHLLIGSLGTQRGIAPRNMIRKCATNGANLYFPLSPEDYYSAALRSPKSVPDSQQISSSFRPIPPSAIMSIPPRSESVVWQRQRMSRGMRRRCCDASAKQSSQHHLRNSLTRFPSPLLTPSFASLLFSDRIGLEVDRRSPSIHLLQSSVAK